MFFGGTPNALSYLALMLWTPLCIIFFRRFPPTKALTISVVGGILLLPERLELFDLPVLPPYGKSLAISVSALAGCLVSSKARRLLALVWREALIVAALIGVSSFLTFLTNRAMLAYGPMTRPALQITDAVLMTSTDVFFMLVPFVIAKACIRAPGDARRFLVFFVAAALLYSIPTLLEIRISPQVHKILYGFHQHSFRQAVRASGWRPMVCMAHGLALTVFTASALILVASLAKHKAKIASVSTRIWTVFLAVVLILCKSLGSIAYGVVLLPIVLVSKGRLQIWVGLALAMFLMVYPWLREAGAIDTESLIAVVADHYPERAESLAFRFDNETELLDRAFEKPLFGWGGYSRSRVFDDSGFVQSVADGSWIVMLGTRGVFGYLIIFGLLVYPVLFVFLKRKVVLVSQEGSLIAALCLVVGMQAIELVPNSYFSFLPFFLSGALAGLLSSVTQTTDTDREEPTASEPRQSPHGGVMVDRPRSGVFRPLKKTDGASSSGQNSS